MAVLDFCEWLKTRFNDNEYNGRIDILDLVLNCEYRHRLEQYAYEYLGTSGNEFRAFLHNFINSKEFEDCLQSCHPFHREWRYYQHRGMLHKEAKMFFHECCHCNHCEERFLRFAKKYEQDNNSYGMDDNVNRLVNSIREYVEYGEKPQALQFLTVLGTDLSLEIDFLEWLMLTKNQPMDLSKMPLNLFENLADEYCSYAGKYNSEKRKLVKSFKQSDPSSLAQKLRAFLSPTQTKRMENLGYIYDRYINRKIPYRCFFLPLAADSEKFEAFINKYWIDLDKRSGDYLDIFYSEDDFGKSGYAIKDKMRMTSRDLPGKLPCIVLWQDKLKEAQSIDIKGLANDEIFDLISSIVGMIQQDMSFTDILKGAKEMTREIRDSHKPITKIIQKIKENRGIVVGGNVEDSTLTVYSGDIYDHSFNDDASSAIRIIESFKEVEEGYRKALISFVNEANSAVQSKNEPAKVSCKDKFKGFVLGAGKAIDKILTALASIATIAAFFGLGA